MTGAAKRLLGADPAITNFGLALFDARLNKRGLVVLDIVLDDFIVGADVIVTAAEAKKRRASIANSDYVRARTMVDRIADRCRMWDVGMIAAEERSFPRGAAAIKSMTAAWTIIASISCLMGIPVVVASPKAIKSMLCGSPTASKDEVEQEILRRHPKAGIAVDMAGIPPGRHNHFFDACGAAEAVRTYDEVLAWLG